MQNGRKVNVELIHEFMQTKQVDRASSNDTIIGNIEPEKVR